MRGVVCRAVGIYLSNRPNIGVVYNCHILKVTGAGIAAKSVGRPCKIMAGGVGRCIVWWFYWFTILAVHLQKADGRENNEKQYRWFFHNRFNNR